MTRKLWPARTKAQELQPIVDLDEIVSADVGFRFNGKVHKLKPMNFETFLKFSNARNDLHSAAQSDVYMTAAGLAERYLKVLEPMCDTITIADIMSMEQAQIAALYQLIIDLVTGQVDTGDGKKKRMKVDLYESVHPLSSQSAQESSAGQSEKL